VINKFICFLLLISLICFSLTLLAQDSGSEAVDMEEDSDRFDFDDITVDFTKVKGV